MPQSRHAETISDRPVGSNTEDWSRPKIIMMLWERGITVRSLSRDSGLASKTLDAALHRPWPRGESIIAKALGVRAEDIWPSRYAARAKRKQIVKAKA
jgi:Ner family transcriptional regulator